METATLPRPPRAPGVLDRIRAADAPTLARLAFGLLVVAVAAGYLLYPTYPNYDSYYSLLWGREVLDLEKPVFEGFRIPTEHPLAIGVGALLSLFGEAADRLWVAMTLASFLALVWGLYRLGRVSFTPLVGAIAAGLLLTRFDFAFLAARGYIDVPYMALVVWAAALEAGRPRRGWPVFVLLALAGMLRPEAWLLSGLYFLWMSWRASWPDRLRYAALTAVAPLVWAGVDAAVTGDPLFSLTYTSSSAEELGRQRSLSEIPSTIPYFFSKLVKLPVWLAALVGLGIATVLVPRRVVMPLALLVTGIGTFVLIGLAGLSVIERYLIVAALALLVFAAVALGGFSMLERGRLRTAWMTLAIVVGIAGGLYTVTRVNLQRFDNELRVRGEAHTALRDILRSPAVVAARRCGPLSLPNHKLVPDTRWIADLGYDEVRARADPTYEPNTGTEIIVNSRNTIFKYAWSDRNDPAEIQVPAPTTRRVATNVYFAAYVSC